MDMLAKRAKIQRNMELDAGTHTYDFSMPLPPQFPSSFVSDFGKIVCEVLLTVNRPFGHRELFRHPLTIFQSYNLNQSPDLVHPKSLAYTKKFSCHWFFCSSPVTATLIIPYGGYTPSQLINFELHVQNPSSYYTVRNIKLKLEQICKYRATMPKHRVRQQITEIAESSHLGAVERSSWRVITDTLKVPSVPPSTHDHRAIEISYGIVVSLTMGDTKEEALFRMPIVIGTIPLAKNISDPTNKSTPPESISHNAHNSNQARSEEHIKLNVISSHSKSWGWRPTTPESPETPSPPEFPEMLEVPDMVEMSTLNESNLYQCNIDVNCESAASSFQCDTLDYSDTVCVDISDD
ncbi:arrestin domain-containing protein 1-like [Scaptodrosophila lebanonensis]|uniref:Arrestin domain-containing protein 1-like n=1 Tax=Drosophila lebanonensis TaxID=7225 RepID=A0A6J2TGS1_DROLE|nr:arrestin domain-containing protein 1-like [Scaptodrosophila lebanonensis]